MSEARQSILTLNNTRAKVFFLRNENYTNIDLPVYFNFKPLLKALNNKLYGRKLSDFQKDKPDSLDGINHTIINNKDGYYAWRPLQLINPAIYVDMVNCITEKENWKLIKSRFKDFSKNPKIRCMSMPVYNSNYKKRQKAEQILNWWQNVEQKSIELALDFTYLITTDITDCYGAIYTHSIAWAMHTKVVAKQNRAKKSLIGNKIDKYFQSMSNGQTNGLPQGSTLIDFTVELLLGYADELLTEKIGEHITDYQIIRYRDDYRIFVNNTQDGEKIVKYLTEVLIDLGLKLNPSKTEATKDVISGSIKKDKMYLIRNNSINENIQKELLLIHDIASNFPNSGTLKVLLTNYYKKIQPNCSKDNIKALVSIVTDIAYNNPTTYNLCTAIISKLINCLEDSLRLEYIEKINKKFSLRPNTGFMDIWLQRISLNIDKSIEYEEKLCKLVKGENLDIWDLSWLDTTIKTVFDNNIIIDEEALKKMDNIISQSEVDIFNKNDYDSSISVEFIEVNNE